MVLLTQGKVALVDDADYEAVSRFKWHARKAGRDFCAARNVTMPDGKRATQYLSQFLMPGVLQVGHCDGNKLNYQRENLFPVLKRTHCKRCNCRLTETNSYRKNGYLRCNCKKCHAIDHAEWRAENPERSHKNDVKWRAENRAKCRGYQRNTCAKFYRFINALKAAPCSDCKNTFPPECMDYDHVRGLKKTIIGRMQTWKRSAIIEEIAKCDLVCSNCHRIRTKKRRNPPKTNPIYP